MTGLFYINADSWRYENLGTADDLIVSGTTLTNLPKSKSITGTAFYQTQCAKCFDIPATDEIWIKFDVYFDGSNRWRAYNGGSNGVTGITAQTDNRLSYFSNGGNQYNGAGICKVNQLQTVLLHMVSGSSNGVIEAWVDGTLIYRYTGDVNHGQDFADIYLQSDGAGTFFSNIIISNEEIALNENVPVPFGGAVIKPEIFISAVTIGKITVKPEIFLSAIPIGKISLLPQIFISYIPAPIHEKVSADSSRNISKNELICADLSRNVGQGNNISADIARNVVKAELINADTKRKITVEENISADSFRRVVQSDTVQADSFRRIQQLEKNYFDTERKTFSNENISADSFRRVVQADSISADTYREVKKAERVVGDISRKIGVSSTRADLQRKINVPAVVNADSCRKITTEEKFSADLHLKVTSEEIIRADIFRKLEDSARFVADLRRNVGVREKISADLYLKVSRDDIARADTCRAVETVSKISADTRRRVAVREKFSAKTKRAVACHETVPADTFLQVATSEKVVADLLLAIREVVRANTFRQIVRSEKAIARTEIRVPHMLIYDVQNNQLTLNKPKLLADNAPALINTFTDYGVTDFSVTLSEKTLSDDFKIDVTHPLEINDTVQGNLFDYYFNFLVEETNQTDMVQSVSGRYSKDDSLYKWFYIADKGWTDEQVIQEAKDSGRFEKATVGEKVIFYPTAIEIMQDIAAYLGMTLDIRIDDFMPNNLDSDSKVTYFDVLNSLFNWTSRLPQRQINVFIRGNTLHVIQRGMESSVFDITDLPHSRPTVNKKFNRVLCFNPNKDNNYDDDDDDEQEKRYSGTISYWDTHFSLSYTYVDGLLIKEQSSSNTADSLTWQGLPVTDGSATRNLSSTTYNYTTFHGNDSYLLSKTSEDTLIKVEEGTVTKVETAVTTNYHYKPLNDDIYLFAEYESTHTKEYEYNNGAFTLTSEENHTRETRHVPIGNGWYAQTVFVDGEQQGANLSQGAPSNKISPYTVKQMQSVFKQTAVTPITPTAQNEDDELSFIVDDSFPVRGEDMKNTLNQALRWLHRKIIETVSVDLVANVVNGVPSIRHVVDFTERIRFNGNVYFLVSNKISFIPRKFIQKLQLVRWYAL